MVFAAENPIARQFRRTTIFAAENPSAGRISNSTFTYALINVLCLVFVAICSIWPHFIMKLVHLCRYFKCILFLILCHFPLELTLTLMKFANYTFYYSEPTHV